MSRWTSTLWLVGLWLLGGSLAASERLVFGSFAERKNADAFAERRAVFAAQHALHAV